MCPLQQTALQLSPPLWGEVAANHKSFFFQRGFNVDGMVSIIAPYESVGSLTVKANES